MTSNNTHKEIEREKNQNQYHYHSHCLRFGDRLQSQQLVFKRLILIDVLLERFDDILDERPDDLILEEGLAGDREPVVHKADDSALVGHNELLLLALMEFVDPVVPHELIA